jgi:hypothetical protein
MIAESILEQINQKPFRPIALETVGGTWIEIDRSEDIFIYDRMKTTCVVLFDTLKAESSFTSQSRLPQSKRGEWKVF